MVGKEVLELLELLDKQLVQPEELDVLVHDAAAALAASYNNSTLAAQVGFLCSQYGEEKTRELLCRELDLESGERESSEEARLVNALRVLAEVSDEEVADFKFRDLPLSSFDADALRKIIVVMLKKTGSEIGGR